MRVPFFLFFFFFKPESKGGRVLQVYKSHVTSYHFQVSHNVLIFCITREKYQGTSKNFTSKPPENQASHCYVLGIWIYSFDVPFKATHSHDVCFLCVLATGLQKVENRSNLMCKSEQTICPSKSLWQQIGTLINFSVSVIIVAFGALE